MKVCFYYVCDQKHKFYCIYGKNNIMLLFLDINVVNICKYILLRYKNVEQDNKVRWMFMLACCRRMLQLKLVG